MQPPNHHYRIDLTELKAQMVKKLGQEMAKQYFYYLNRFLSLKMSLKMTKPEFDKLCFRILGRENIPLHNHFIRSILKNACSAKSPPPQNNDITKHATKISGKEIPKDAYLANGSHTVVTHTSGPISPRKVRTCLLPNVKTSLARQLFSATLLSDFNVILENGDLNHHPSETLTTIPLEAPLGVPFCPVRIGGARIALPIETSGRCIGTTVGSTLLDCHTLRERMERIATMHNLEGVSGECVNVLNHGLDLYLKGLIMSCIELVGVRSDQELVKCSMKLVNGVRPGYLHQIENRRKECPISLQDFRVAMEMNPRQLGEDWPSLLEKICTEAYEE